MHKFTMGKMMSFLMLKQVIPPPYLIRVTVVSLLDQSWAP
jgi:hypothetical protein